MSENPGHNFLGRAMQETLQNKLQAAQPSQGSIIAS